MSTAVTPCRGRSAVYDAINNPHTSTEKRREARQIAAALCARCPIAGTCPDRVTPPARPRHRKATRTMTQPQPTPPPAPAVIGTQELIAWGQRHPSSRVQTLAARAATSLTELAQMREKDKVVSAAEARVKELQAELAREQARLREAKGAGATPSGTPKRSKEESLRIRAWARENSYDCPAAGILPRRIVEAYEAAHSGLAASA